jgi:flagellar basal body-associated protein FliL
LVTFFLGYQKKKKEKMENKIGKNPSRQVQMNLKIVAPIVVFVLAVIGIIVAVVVTSSSSAAPVTPAPATPPPVPKNDGGTNAAKMEIPTMRDLTGVDASSFTVNSIKDAITQMAQVLK